MKKTFEFNSRYVVTSNLFYYLTLYSSYNSVKVLKLKLLLLHEKLIEQGIPKEKFIFNKNQDNKKNILTFLNFIKHFLHSDDEEGKKIYNKIERIYQKIEQSNDNFYEILDEENHFIHFKTRNIKTIWNLEKIEKELNFYNQKVENKRNRKTFLWTVITAFLFSVILTPLITELLTFIKL